MGQIQSVSYMTLFLLDFSGNKSQTNHITSHEVGFQIEWSNIYTIITSQSKVFAVGPFATEQEGLGHWCN